jgi:hypothetical protein
MITSHDYTGALCRLVNAKGKPIKPNQKIRTLWGHSVTVTDGSAPHKQGSTGRIFTDQGAYFPGVICAQWLPV